MMNGESVVSIFAGKSKGLATWLSRDSLVTADHCVEGCHRVRLGGSEGPKASVTAMNEAHDVAWLQLIGNPVVS